VKKDIVPTDGKSKGGVAHRARRIIDRHKEMKRDKNYWLYLFQLMGEYIMTRKQHFTTDGQPGELQTEHLFDDTAVGANQLMAAAIIGAIWPNGAKSFRISMPFDMEDEIGEETEEVKDYYQWSTKRMASYMDNPKSGLQTALEEYMLDQGAFGISGILTEEQEDNEIPLTYRALDAKAMCIDEGENGFVNTIYIERHYTIRQMVEKYGFENISSKWQEQYLKGDCKSKVPVLQAIEPRLERDPYGFGVKNMPYASIHIDTKTEKIMKESGFQELPAAVTRFWKAMGEKYGRSPGMNALSSILEANALGEAWTMAVEKTLDPVLLVMDDGSLGGGTIDTSPGATVVVSVSGRMGNTHKPIEPLFVVGDLQWTAARRTELIELIKNHFFQDRLMDLNNEKQMTLGEANIRNELRGQTLNTVYARQFGELLVPTIERTFNSLLRRGFLGVIRGSRQEADLLAKGLTPKIIPDAVAKRLLDGREAYRIEFISPATRIMQAEELAGINTLLNTAVMIGAAKPDAYDRVDTDWIIGRVQELTGAPRESIVAMETVKKVRDARAKQVAEAAEMEKNRQGSETARNMGQAVASIGGTKQQGAA